MYEYTVTRGMGNLISNITLLKFARALDFGILRITREPYSAMNHSPLYRRPDDC